MEDAAEAVVPLRPGFDINLRGFDRKQVIEHIELLEDQLRMVTIDRNEAVQLNNDLRKLYDETRRALDEAEQRLKRIESSDTGLPAASQRVQNMLSIAEEEVQTLREKAKRQAEVIRKSAETEARELISQAEQTASEIRAECTELINDIDERRKQLHREHEQKASDIRRREQRMRAAIRDEYKKTMSAAQEEIERLREETEQACQQRKEEAERLYQKTMEEIRAEQAELAELRNSVLGALSMAKETLDTSVDALRHRTEALQQEGGPAEGEADKAPTAQAVVPEQREGIRSFLIPFEREHHTNGATPPADPTGTARQS